MAREARSAVGVSPNTAQSLGLSFRFPALSIWRPLCFSAAKVVNEQGKGKGLNLNNQSTSLWSEILDSKLRLMKNEQAIGIVKGKD